MFILTQSIGVSFRFPCFSSWWIGFSDTQCLRQREEGRPVRSLRCKTRLFSATGTLLSMQLSKRLVLMLTKEDGEIVVGHDHEQQLTRLLVVFAFGPPYQAWCGGVVPSPQD